MSIPAQSVPNVPMVDSAGLPTLPWYSFFLNLWQRTGAATGGTSAILDTITNVAGSILYRGTSLWQGLNPGAHYTVLRMGAADPEWDLLDGNSFGNTVKNLFFASPLGATGIPTFRQIANADLVPIAGQFPGTPTNDNAATGNIGEYLEDAPAAIAMTSGAPADLATLVLTPGDWDVWGSVVSVPAGTTTQSDIKGWINSVSATDPGSPNKGAYTELQTTIAAGLGQTLPVGSQRISVPNTGNQNIYLSANITFATSTLQAQGFLAARRRR